MMLRRHLYLLFLSLTLIGCSYAPVVGPRRFDLATEPTLVPTSEAVARPIYTVQEGLVTQQLTFEARVSPRAEIEVFPTTSGTIGFVLVEEGDFVIAGDPIANYDDGQILEELARLQEALADQEGLQEAEAEQQADRLERAVLEVEIAQLELSKAAQSTAESETERDTEIALLSRKLELAQRDYDALVASLSETDIYAEEIARIQSELSALEAQQATGVITAPGDGVVVGLAIQPGSSVNPETPIAIIAPLGGVDDLSLAAVLRSEVLEQLEEGMPVTIQFEREVTEPFAGSIARLPYPYNVGGLNLGFAETDSAIRILPDDLAILDQVQIGALAEITVVVAQNDEALWVDPSGVREFSGRNFVIVKDGNRERRVDIELGLAEEGRVEIIGAVEPGQEVVGP